MIMIKLPTNAAAARVNYDTTRLSNITKVLGLQLYGTIPPVWAGMTVGSGFETGETVCQLLMMGMDDGRRTRTPPATTSTIYYLPDYRTLLWSWKEASTALWEMMTEGVGRRGINDATGNRRNHGFAIHHRHSVTGNWYHTA